MERIPKISDERLEELVERIKPVVRFIDNPKTKKLEPYPTGILFYIEKVNTRRESFCWNPTPTKKAEDIEFLDAILTYHTFVAPALFKPSVAEVIAQIPEKYLNEVIAFETIYDNFDCRHATKDGYHITLTKLYKKKNSNL